jgi:tRNA dimethylallyltransferase
MAGAACRACADRSATAARLEPTDAQRIQRALEVCELAGRPLSELHNAREKRDAIDPAIAVALIPQDRAALHARIAQRFDAMLAAGLVRELAALRAAMRSRPDLPAMRCVGYRQAWEFLDGRIDAPALRAQGIAATRQLAKRQYTWLRATPAAAFDPANPSLDEAVFALLVRKGASPPDSRVRCYAIISSLISCSQHRKRARPQP